MYVYVKRTDEIIYTVCIKNIRTIHYVGHSNVPMLEAKLYPNVSRLQAMHAGLKLNSKEYNSSALVVVVVVVVVVVAKLHRAKYIIFLQVVGRSQCQNTCV